MGALANPPPLPHPPGDPCSTASSQGFDSCLSFPIWKARKIKSAKPTGYENGTGVSRGSGTAWEAACRPCPGWFGHGAQSGRASPPCQPPHPCSTTLAPAARRSDGSGIMPRAASCPSHGGKRLHQPSHQSARCCPWLGAAEPGEQSSLHRGHEKSSAPRSVVSQHPSPQGCTAGASRDPHHPSQAPSAEVPDALEYARNAALGRFGIISSLPPLFSHKGLALIPESGCAALHSPFQHIASPGGPGVPTTASHPRATQPPPGLQGSGGPPPPGHGAAGLAGDRELGDSGGRVWVLQPPGCHGHGWNGDAGAAPGLNPPPAGGSAQLLNPLN